MAEHLVVARADFEESLTYLGSVDAADAEAAGAAALARYGDAWVELRVAPAERVQRVIGQPPVPAPEPPVPAPEPPVPAVTQA